VKELALADGLPYKFLEGIAADFRKNRLIEVKRGAQGGYRLARSLKEISFLEVLRCLDPERERRTIENNRERKSSKQESVYLFLKQTSDSVNKVFGEIMLDALPALHAQDDAFMYYI
jgi:Rrf2 family protein